MSGSSSSSSSSAAAAAAAMDEFERSQLEFETTVAPELRRLHAGVKVGGSEAQAAALKMTSVLRTGSGIVQKQAAAQAVNLRTANQSLQDISGAAFTDALLVLDVFREFAKKRGTPKATFIDAEKMGKMFAPFFNRPPVLEFRPVKGIARKRKAREVASQVVEDPNRRRHPEAPKLPKFFNVTGAMRQRYMEKFVAEAAAKGECAFDFCFSPHYHEMVENLYDLGVLAAGFERGRSVVGIEYRDELPFLMLPSNDIDLLSSQVPVEDSRSQRSQRLRRFPLVWAYSKEDHMRLLPYYENHNVRFTRCGSEKPNRYAGEEDLEDEAGENERNRRRPARSSS